MTKLFVGGFPLDMAEMELVQLIMPHGTVSTIKIVRDKKTRQCKGYAFLEMADLESAQNAIEALDGTAIQDRVLSLNIVQEKPVAPPRPSWGGNKSYSSSGSSSRPPQRTGSYDSSTREREKRPRKVR